ncbi:MAG: AMP-binding protein [Jatrophihabitantaceae bacterium]
MSGIDRQKVLSLWAHALAPDEAQPPQPEADVPFSLAGGHSLAAARLIAAIRSELGRQLPFVRILREDPTPDQLVEMLAGVEVAGPSESPQPAGVAASRRTHLRAPLAHWMRPVWAYHRLHPESPAYNVVRVLTMAGRISPGALRAAAAQVADRHEALRACVPESRPGHPEFLVRPSVAPALTIEVIRVADPDTASDWELSAPAEVQAALAAAADGAFDMARAPLWRLHVVYVPELERTWLTLVMHHLVSDLRASDVVLFELADAYGAQVSGAPARVSEAPSLVAHLTAESALAVSPDAEQRHRADMEWWAQTLAGCGPARPLPLSRAAAPLELPIADSVMVGLDTAAVEGLARELRVTTATVLMTAATLVLASWRGPGAGADVVGVPSMRSQRSEDQDLVGFLVDTVPVRCALDLTADFAAACDAVRSTYLDGLEHASATLGDIMSRLAIPRESTRTSLIGLWFNDLTHARRPPRFASLDTVEYDFAPRWALFDHGLYVNSTSAGIRVHSVVPRGTLSAADHRALLEQLRRVVEGAIRDWSRPVEELLRPEPEPRLELPLGSADTTAQLIRERANRDPDAPAVRHPDGELSYGQLAAAITTAATGWDERCRIALGADRSLGHVVARLAAVDSGASVVLVDSGWPAQRQRMAIEAAGATEAVHIGENVLGQVRLVPRAADGGGQAIQFTSGTSGTPMGVATAHAVRQVCLDELGNWLGMGAQDRMSFLSGPSHDPSWRDIELPLRAGASLHLPPQSVQHDPLQLVGWLLQSRITVACLTPPLLAIALDGAAPASLPELRLVISGGAPLSGKLVRRLHEVAPTVTVLNGYGCTETPQLLTALRLEPATPIPTDGDLPVGTALPGRHAEVRTSTGAPCDTGQLGSIWACGPRIAQGYLGDGPALDRRLASRFRTDPDGTRWFETGDLARHDAAGVLTLAGRGDRQRLVNGHRVVLDEIEAIARGVPGVAGAVVEVIGSGSTQSLRLSVSVTPGAQQQAQADVRTRLRELLPSALVPARVDVVDALPLTGNLKSQPPPVTGEADAGPVSAVPVDIEPASSDLDAVRELAETVLGAPLRLSDNFFEAGFDSVTLLHFGAELGNLLGCEVAATALFRYPSLQRLLPELGVRWLEVNTPVRTRETAAPRPTAGAGAEPTGTGAGQSSRDRRRQLRTAIRRELRDPD